MTLPRSIKILGNTFQIKLGTLKGEWGNIDPEKLEINLDRKSLKRWEDILWHEILHEVCENVLELKITHRELNTLASIIAGIIKDNKLG